MDREDLLRLVSAVKAMTPAACAHVILRGVEKNKPIIVVTWLGYVIWWLTRLSPRAAMWFWRTAFLARMRRALTVSARR